MPSFSPEQLRFLAGLPSDVSNSVLQGHTTFHSVLMATLNASSTSTSYNPAPSSVTPDEPSTSFEATTGAPGTQVSSRRTQHSFTFPQALSFLRAARDEDPFSGSNATRKTAWEAVLRAFHSAGGNSDIGVDWLKKKVNEFIDYHESTKPRTSSSEAKENPKVSHTSATGIVRKIMDVPENWTTLASCLDKISENRLKGKNESYEESAKRRQVETHKTAVGKAIVEASLRTFTQEFFPLDSASNAIKTDAAANAQDDDDEIMFLDESGDFIPFKFTADVKVKTEDVEMNIDTVATAVIKKEFHEQENIKPSTSPSSSRRRRTIDRSADLLKDASDKFTRSLDLQERMVQTAENQNKILQDQHKDQMDFQNNLLSIFRDMVNSK
ncbi:hypothetical protein EV360DRAFT_89094 [Lentinula raphanica]|nr:hypothetical protein EV360DRAFT_89094 [Lentinula raphanica]